MVALAFCSDSHALPHRIERTPQLPHDSRGSAGDQQQLLLFPERRVVAIPVPNTNPQVFQLNLPQIDFEALEVAQERARTYEQVERQAVDIYANLVTRGNSELAQHHISFADSRTVEALVNSTTDEDRREVAETIRDNHGTNYS